ncbi:hypothetical protein VU11_06335 [Desulfobulbus sp. US2]|nr:hypothetical protein [Desulfobulbus sp. US2]
MQSARIGNQMIARMVERRLLPSAVTLYRKCKGYFLIVHRWSIVAEARFFVQAV